ncbi:MAG: CHASE2 domain-containing protein, partial [Kiloniellaceae bacterium]
MSTQALPQVALAGGFLRRLYRHLHVNGRSRSLALALLLALLVLQVWDPAPLEILRQRIFDLYQVAKPRQSLQQPVVIIDIDEESLAEIGQWPWPRNEVARLVDRLRDAGVAAVAFDVVFAEPDRGLPDNDALLAQALGSMRAVLGESAYHRRLAVGPRAVPRPLQLALIGGNPAPHLYRFPDVVRNIDQLETAAAGRAVFNLVPASDGVVRQVPAFVAVEERILPTLTVELLRIATGGNAIAIKTDAAGVRAFVVGGVEVPTDRNGRLWVYYSQPRPELYVSARDLLSGAVGPERLAGKLALIGTSAAGLHDIKASPLRDGVPGVEIHAQVLETIISGQVLVRPHYALGAELLLLAVAGLLLIALVPLIGAAFTLLLGGCVAIGLSLGSWLLFTHQGMLFDVAYPLAGSAAVFTLLVFANYLREESRRQQVRSAFDHYLSPALVDQLASDPSRLVLGGESRDMTI